MTDNEPRTVKQAAWDLHKETQRAERRGLRPSIPGMTNHDAAERGRANAKAARRRKHHRRRSNRVSPDHHAARVQSKLAAHRGM